ncbi:unnamed protein product [Somion occarium]|uniref:NADP-dependent oxidoreductase domain-containing protein n=1 Tax=Somion occarium TaxID=3059160 RepID=A0ABP1DM40_9APHY
MAASALTFQSTVKLLSGYEIPRLGFGVAYGFGKEEDPLELTKPGVLEALKVGYRHIDSAQLYRNEREVGEAVRESGLKREDVFVTSKVPDEGEPLASVDASLKALGFGKLNVLSYYFMDTLKTRYPDYIDLYLIHSPPAGKENRLTKYKALLEAKRQGKVRTVGVSNYNIHHIEEIREAGLELPSVNQVELHPFCQQRPIIEYCNKHNIAVEAYCPVIRGKLDDPVIVDIAKKHGKEPAQVLLRWSLQHDLIPLVRSSNPARILSNTQIYDFALDEDDVKRLDALDRGAEGAISWNPIDVV